MMKFRIFIASPQDVREERETLSNVVIPELQRIFASPPFFDNDNQIELESIRWETHTWPDAGDDVQDVINKQLSDFDVFVGIMWKRFGTPTRRAESGTGEEFERAYSLHRRFGRPRIMFYFRTEPFYPASREEVAQVDKVIEFKQRLDERGVRFWSYERPIDFERFAREHLIRQIFAMVANVEGRRPERRGALRIPALEPREVRVFISYAREDRDTAIRLTKELEKHGVKTWLDVENLLPGQAWQHEIQKAIQRSDYFLALLSSHSVSKRGFLQKELKLALDVVDELPESKIFLLPVRLDECSISHERLAGIQWVDMFPDWEDGMQRMLRAMNMEGREWRLANNGFQRTPEDRRL